MRKMYSTEQVADMVGVHRVTMQRWITAGKVHASQVIPMQDRQLHRWSAADIKAVKRYKEAFYRKGRGPKKKA